MLFQREKKQLWRYASSNNPPVSGATINQPQRPHHHQPQHRPQLCQQQQQQCYRQPPTSSNVTPAHHHHPARMSSAMSCSIFDCCKSVSTSSQTSFSSTIMNQQSQPLNTPPQQQSPPALPYSSMPYGVSCRHVDDNDYTNRRQHQQQQQLTYQQQQQKRQQQTKTETSTITGVDSELVVTECDYNKSAGYYCGSYGDTMVVDDYEQAKAPKQQRKQSPPPALQTAQEVSLKTNSSSNSSPMMMTSPQLSSFATTAANVFRHCCGAGCLSNESSTSGTMTTTTINNNCYGGTQKMEATTPQQQMGPTIERATMWVTGGYNAHSTGHSATLASKKESFLFLMKKMKAPQVTTLLLAVKSFCDPSPATPSTTATTNATSSNGGQKTNCILLKRGLIRSEEPYVIACRLFFWNDLRGAFELKRLPICSNGRDPVYDCCNPLHWSRILVPETAPPPYQPLLMERLKNEEESSQNGGNSTTASMHSSSSSSSNFKSDLRVQIPESFTTDGEDCRSLAWCQVAYWELAQRVGERYAAEKSLINIYSDGPRTGSNSAGMCLKDLSDKKSTPSPESVQKTRQKIGLGVTLSQESDGVWLYNRSAAPIFVHSPTLNECCFHVCKVMPGYCLKAFDKNRAREQTMLYTQQIGGPQLGPVDRFSMRISFAKGWGAKYCRQDITACPCWLEVLFTRR